ncbi:hypothetical protein CSKR_102923 [Clonorchis sinensis]|uniref:Uncharacterized protein n=1 Tax=Clonorchis sinensis TaxID=79923 RepID=A0A3R7GXL2_CLOSI|nr:hypothetical protein CSKR_102923 [Clonorchis sinensis]
MEISNLQDVQRERPSRNISPSESRCAVYFCVLIGTAEAGWLKWLEREFNNRKVRGSNPTSASRLPLSRLGQPGSISALVLPSGGMAARHRKGVTAERFLLRPEIAPLTI